MASRKILCFFILFVEIKSYHATKAVSLTEKLDEKLEYKFSELTSAVTQWLEEFNDKNLANSEMGRWIHYNTLKPKFGETSRQGKTMKKMSMALLPMVFHMGATSTWMLLTSLMAAKSVAIGLALLVFKIAVSSAKVASFFTSLKASSKQNDDASSWSPQMAHGHYRSVTDGSYAADWNSYTPEVMHSGVHPYRWTYKNHEHGVSPFEDEYIEEPNKRRS